MMEATKAIEEPEAHIIGSKNILLVFSVLENESLVQDFCGAAIDLSNDSSALPDLTGKSVYLCGDISKSEHFNLDIAERVFVVRELSHGYSDILGEAWALVDAGRIPILVHGVGILYRRFFEAGSDYFKEICAEHTFQSLTESNKPGKAHRTGLYLTPVERECEDLHFRLLRCSTNLSGPTETFRANDKLIVGALNQEATTVFENYAPLNHVLAQIYYNTPASEQKKQTKAKIKAHADKTKDMPSNGIMAFCTFYDGLDKLEAMEQDPFDYGLKKTSKVSGLTRLVFRLKEAVTAQQQGTLPSQFSVTLYPDSVFFMPLSTNRLYVHEIRPSSLEAEKLPTRLGYVVRCSSAEAVHKNGATFLKSDGELKMLEPPTPVGICELGKLYTEENKTADFIDYADKFMFSMNEGDYMAPQDKPTLDFRQLTLSSVQDDLFEELMTSVEFEELGLGRRGTVLTNPDEVRGTPIVRTTSQYAAPATCFRPVHTKLAQQIQTLASLGVEFNNALIENYTNAYAKMGSHSDQALDLEDKSSIAIFSCYKNPELGPERKLVVESKDPGGSKFEIPLAHNSVVVFSLDTNRQFKHKIVLDVTANPPENEWLGVTFRTSKIFVQFRDKQAFFEDDTPLTLADEEQRKAFYSLRSQENKGTDVSYPRVKYTISKSDMMPARHYPSKSRYCHHKTD